MLACRHIKQGLIQKLLMTAFSQHPLIPGTQKFDSNFTLFKCAHPKSRVPLVMKKANLYLKNRDREKRSTGQYQEHFLLCVKKRWRPKRLLSQPEQQSPYVTQSVCAFWEMFDISANFLLKQYKDICQ